MFTAVLGTALTSLPFFPAAANPEGEKIVSGSVTVARDGARTDIHQSTDRAIIDWRSFSIGAGEITQFHQPSAASVTLNRVSGIDPSQILGQLQANGQIMLINPNGILFGAGSRIDVSALVATTADIANEDFLAGRHDFRDGSAIAGAGIVNRGSITIADTGYAALVGPYVRNEGTIAARLGRVSLGGAEAFTLDIYGDQLVTFRVGVRETPVDEAGNPVAALVGNSGRIAADGGVVQLAARNIGALVQSVVNTDGVIRANTIENRNGTIILGSSGPGGVTVGGDVRADGGTVGISGDGDVRLADVKISAARIAIAADADESGAADTTVTTTGGDALVADSTLTAAAIDISGDRVALTGNTLVDASGGDGGGTVRIGGAFQGGDGLRAADATFVGKDTNLRADATDTGDAGRVIVWADGSTRFLGSISATGGAHAGNGGFAEVSGKQHLDFRGTADLTAAQGEVGTLLLDPNDITISGGADSNMNLATYASVNDTAVLNATTLTTALGSANVVVQTATAGTNLEAGNISVATAIAGPASAFNLTLVAHNNITFSFGANINMTAGTGGLTLTAGNVIVPAAVSSFSANGAVTFNGIVAAAGPTVTITGSSFSGSGFNFGSTAAGTLSITAGDINTGSILLGNSITLTSTGTGVIVGNGLDVASLTLNSGASVDMFGIVNGAAGPATAAAVTSLTDAPTHLFNYCQKGGACFYPPVPGDLDLVPVVPGDGFPPPIAELPIDPGLDLDPGGDGSGGGGPGGIGDGSFGTLPGDDLFAGDFGLDAFLLLLEEEGMDLDELERQIRTVRGPLAELAAGLDGILDRYDMAVAAFIPKDAFNGKFAVVVRGLVNFQPPVPKEPQSGPGGVFVAPGFGIFQQ